MKTQSFFIKHISLLFVLGTCFSCIKDTDFEQDDALILYPTVELNLVNAQEQAASFVDSSGTELPFISNQVVFDVFNSGFSVDNLIKAELVFGITNSINKAFQIKVDFYDNADALQHTFSIDIDNSPSNTPLFTEHIEVFENMSLTALKSTHKLIITFTLISTPTSSVLTSGSEGSILFASKGVFYLKISS